MILVSGHIKYLRIEFHVSIGPDFFFTHMVYTVIFLPKIQVIDNLISRF